jgi:hypothetical protein
MGDICLSEKSGPRIASPLTLTSTCASVLLEDHDYLSKVGNNDQAQPQPQNLSLQWKPDRGIPLHGRNLDRQQTVGCGAMLDRAILVLSHLRAPQEQTMNLAWRQSQ